MVEDPRGGWFAPIHAVAEEPLPGRSVATVTAHLLTTNRPFGQFRRLGADAVHFFHAGGPMSVLTVNANGIWDNRVLGPNVAEDQHLQVVVPGGSWKALILDATGATYSLISQAVAHGWISKDEDDTTVAALATAHPDLALQLLALAERVAALTPGGRWR
jgi:hypothetical protein